MTTNPTPKKMNDRSRIAPAAAEALLTLCLPSCVSVSRTLDEPKLPVSFASASAAQSFYDATFVPNTDGMKMGAVSFYFPININMKLRSGQLRFNDAVRSADKDGDRRISTAEATAYAEDQRELRELAK